MLNELKKIMNEHNESSNKDKIFQKNQTYFGTKEQNKALKDSLEELNNGFNQSEKNISEHEEKSFEIIQRNKKKKSEKE